MNRKIIGKEVVNDVLYYWVRWAETLEPEHSLGDAKEIDSGQVRSLALRLRSGRRGPGSNRGKHVVVT